jgi:hypothetical protein
MSSHGSYARLTRSKSRKAAEVESDETDSLRSPSPVIPRRKAAAAVAAKPKSASRKMRVTGHRDNSQRNDDVEVEEQAPNGIAGRGRKPTEDHYDSAHQPTDDPQFIVQSHLMNAGRRVDNANKLVHDLSSYGYEADLLHRADDKLQRMARNTKMQRKSYDDYASAMVTALAPVAPGVNFTSYAWLNGDDMVNTKLAMSAKEQAIVNKRDTVVRAWSQKRDYIKNATAQLDTEKAAVQAEMLAASNAEEEWAAQTSLEDDTMSRGDIPIQAQGGYEDDEE